jgi:hypothetical protein
MPAVVAGIHLLSGAVVQSFRTKEEAYAAFEKGKAASLVKIIDK